MSLALAGYFTTLQACSNPIQTVFVTQASKKETFSVWTKHSEYEINKYRGSKDYTAVLQFWIELTDWNNSSCMHNYLKPGNPPVTASKNGNFLVLKNDDGSEVKMYFFKIADYEFLLEDEPEKQPRLLVVLHRATHTCFDATLKPGAKFPNIPVRKDTKHILQQYTQ